MKRNSKTKGDESEIKIILSLLSAGHFVSVPFGDNSKYDLVVDADGTLYRVQCKTAWVTEMETIRFNPHSQTTRDGQYHESPYHGEIEAFMVREPESETIYWVDIDDATEHKMDLRYEAEVDHPSINWPHDFEFDGEIPGGTDDPPLNEP